MVLIGFLGVLMFLHMEYAMTQKRRSTYWTGGKQEFKWFYMVITESDPLIDFIKRIGITRHFRAPKRFIEYSKCVKHMHDRTDFLVALMNEYDSGIPPNFEKDEPCNVTLSLYINSIDSIDEQTMEFTLGMFVRQEWVDSRLRFLNLISAESLELDSRLMEGIWVPDLYFRNEKKAYFHTVTFPNKMLHLYQDGRINYRSRLTVTATCPMKLHRYPMDRQVCSLYIQSFAYSTNRLVFNWRSEAPVRRNPDMQLPQFTLDGITTADCTRDNRFDEDPGNFTCIRFDLHLKRNIGYYMIQMYIPSGLVVMLSWLSFWLHVDAVPARVTLGILTVLTMTTQRSVASASLARVSYVKAIDIWMATCLCFVFCALLEYAFVNVLSRKKPKKKYFESSEKKGQEPLMNGVISERRKSGSSLQRVLPVSATAMDNISKLLFPIVFLVFCVLYWSFYLTNVD